MTAIAPSEYEFIRQLVHQHSRIELGPDKQGLVTRRVQSRLAALGLAGFGDYCSFLRTPRAGGEMTELLDAISTNVTDFFREQDHFVFLREVALPAWQERPARGEKQAFRVWSAACSSGEEAYSLAIVLAEFFRAQTDGSWQVEASDISTQMLERARVGIYEAKRINLPAAEWGPRYFQRGVGRCEGHWRVKESLRRQVRFQQLNLFQNTFTVTGGLDVIFCRNVMIYFDRAAQEELVQRLGLMLAPGGYLFVGHAESLVGIGHALKNVRPSIYQREN